MKKETKAQTASAAVKKLLSIMLAFVMLFSITAGIEMSAYAANGVQTKIANIAKKYPNNSYFSTTGKACGPGQTNGWCTYCQLAKMDSAAFKICGNGDSCWGFANYVFYNTFGIAAANSSNSSKTVSTNDLNKYAKIGDYIICYNSKGNQSHYFIFMGTNGSSHYRYESNYTKENLVKYKISCPSNGYEGTISKYKIIHASNYDKVNGSTTTPTVTNPSVTVNAISNLTTNSVRINFTAKNPSKVTIKTVGVEVRKKGDNTWKTKQEAMNSSYTNATSVPMWWDVGSGKEFNISLISGTTYEYRAYVVYNGKNYYSSTSTFTTKGSAPHTHDYYWYSYTKRPTCTEGGYTEYHCSCGDWYKSDYTSVTAHNYDDGIVTEAANCTMNGIKTYTCLRCKATKTETIKATGHKAVTDKSIAATCTNAGKTAGSHCSVCNTVIKKQETVKATGHSYDAGKVTKAPTVTATGVKTYTCTKCKATKTETIKATGLKAPTLKVTVNANGTFKMTWSKVSGADKYEIYYKQADGSYKLLKTVTGTSYTTVFAQYGKQYSYKMRAVKGSIKSDYSKVVNATNNKKLQTPTLKIAVNTNGTFKMTWNKVSGADKYEIYYKQADGSYKLLKTVTGTSYTSGFAQYGKQYSYKMRALTSKNSSATSNYSSVVNAKNTKKLGTPTMKATVNKNGSFKLSWGKVTGATSYQIYWKQADGSYKLLKTVSGTSYTTVVARKGKTYSYKVRAVTSGNKNATSNYSSVVSAKRK